MTRIPPHLRPIAATARKAGWRIERTRRHLKWIAPDGRIHITGSTPGVGYGHTNDLYTLRKALKGHR